ncbi:MAG: penicillin-binding protein activator [Candidatus Binatia bacterium]
MPALRTRPVGHSLERAAAGSGRRRRCTVPLLGVLALAALAGCSARSTPLDDGPLPYRQAEDNFRLGNYEKAARGYQIFLDSESADEFEDLVPRAYYRMALAEYRRGRFTECLTVLDKMERELPDRQWPQVYSLRGDAELARGNTISALRWWELGYDSAEGAERREARQHIVDALDRMDQAALTRARGVLTTPDMRALVDARLKAKGGPITAPPGAAPPPATSSVAPPLPPPSGASVAPILPDQGGVAAPRIAALLPLSGQYATYGQRSLNGIKLALGTQAGALLVRDSKGEPQVARAALDELIADPNVIAVIGPLRSKTAEAIAPRAERAGLPMVVLSQQEGVTGRWVIQPAMTSERQASELAEYAIAQGLRRVAILYPNDPYGIALSSAFRQQIDRRGGTVVGSVVYEPTQKEFSVELLSVDKWIKGDGLQAVFIPDFAPTALPLATQLRRAHPGVVLLGSNGWNDPAALGPVAADLDGAVFVDGFFASSQRRATQDFVAAYRAAYSSAPEILEAQAYDAAALVGRALQSGARSRAQMGAALQSSRIEGAAGTVAMSPQGVQRQLFLLRLSNGTISEIVITRPAAPASAPAPAPFSEPLVRDAATP